MDLVELGHGSGFVVAPESLALENGETLVDGCIYCKTCLLTGF